MRGANIFAGIVGALWLSLLWLGIDLTRGVSAQHVPNYPNSGQIFYYIGVPLSVAAGLLIVSLILNRIWRSPALLSGASGCALLFLIPYMLGYTGGV